MTASGVLEQARYLGVEMWRTGNAIRYRGPATAVQQLQPLVRKYRRQLLVILPSPSTPMNLTVCESRNIRAGKNCERCGGPWDEHFDAPPSPRKHNPSRV